MMRRMIDSATSKCRMKKFLRKQLLLRAMAFSLVVLASELVTEARASRRITVLLIWAITTMALRRIQLWLLDSRTLTILRVWTTVFSALQTRKSRTRESTTWSIEWTRRRSGWIKFCSASNAQWSSRNCATYVITSESTRKICLSNAPCVTKRSPRQETETAMRAKGCAWDATTLSKVHPKVLLMPRAASAKERAQLRLLMRASHRITALATATKTETHLAHPIQSNDSFEHVSFFFTVDSYKVIFNHSFCNLYFRFHNHSMSLNFLRFLKGTPFDI